MNVEGVTRETAGPPVRFKGSLLHAVEFALHDRASDFLYPAACGALDANKVPPASAAKPPPSDGTEAAAGARGRRLSRQKGNKRSTSGGGASASDDDAAAGVSQGTLPLQSAPTGGGAGAAADAGPASPAQSPLPPARFFFEVTFPEDTGRAPLALYADSDESRAAWIKAINKSKRHVPRGVRSLNLAGPPGAEAVVTVHTG